MLDRNKGMYNYYDPYSKEKHGEMIGKKVKVMYPIDGFPGGCNVEGILLSHKDDGAFIEVSDGFPVWNPYECIFIEVLVSCREEIVV